MTDALFTILRALAKGKHDDLSIGEEAADRIEELEKKMNDCGFTWTTSDKLVDEPTLRDKFAMAALTGLLAGAYSESPSDKVTALAAYHVADAMMEAREK